MADRSRPPTPKANRRAPPGLFRPPGTEASQSDSHSCRLHCSFSACIKPTHPFDKLLFTEILLSLRASAHTGVAIPRLEGECIDNCPTGREILRFLVVIVTRFHSTGGLPHQSADWFAMTGNFDKCCKQQFIFSPPLRSMPIRINLFSLLFSNR